MTKEDLTTAKHEANRFLNKIKELEKNATTNSHGMFDTSKYVSAVKRSSMDLSRALSELRKSKWD